ncbi:MAG: sugar phosphate nucleotidyltransferase [Candidatus Rifleibacteriota bacterium]
MKNLKYIDKSRFPIVSTRRKLKEIIALLDKSGYETVFVLNHDNKRFAGFITDKEIRKTLLKGNYSPDMQAFELMNTRPIALKINSLEQKQSEIFAFSQAGLKHLPVLDEENRLLKILATGLKSKKPARYDNRVVIMAGGKGKRLLPLTRFIPKPLVPFGGTTMIEKIMNHYEDDGFHNFIISINYKGDAVKDYLQKLAYKVSYVEEDFFRGTAGSLSHLRERDLKEPVFVSNCDTLLGINFSDVLARHKLMKSDLTIVALRKIVRFDYGVIKFDEEHEQYKGFAEKPIEQFLINTGNYILNPEIINLIGRDEVIDMPDLIDRAKEHDFNIKLYISQSDMLDIGRWEEYRNFL